MIFLVLICRAHLKTNKIYCFSNRTAGVNLRAKSVLYIGTDYELYSTVKKILNECLFFYAPSTNDGLRQLNFRAYVLIIIDIDIVPADCKELLQALRRAYSVPIIALHNYTEDEDVVRVLNSGADFPLHRSVSPAVLVAYARSLITRYTVLDHLDRESHTGEALLRAGDFEVDLVRRRVFIKGSPIKLSHKEYDLFCFFARNPDRVLTEEQIYERVWHTDKEYHSSLYKPINRLRQKIEPDLHDPVYIHTIRSVGYQFTPIPVGMRDI